MGKLSLEDWRNIATIIAAIIAVAVYITNSIHQHRQRKLENIVRYIEAHRKLFKSKFLVDNWTALEKGMFQRNTTDPEMEKDFSRLLGEIEYFALLQATNAISSTMSIYMFGFWAQKLQPLLTNEERNNVYWELAVHFLNEMKAVAEDFYKKTRQERNKYFKHHHFSH